MTDRLSDPGRGSGGGGGLPCACVPSMTKAYDYSGDVTIDRLSDMLVDECARPTHGMTGSRFEFTLESFDGSFVHLGTMTLNCRFKVVGSGGAVLTSVSHKPGVVNSIVASLWSSVTVKINDQELNPLSAHHPGYKSVVSNLLSYNRQGAKHLVPGGFRLENGEHNGTLSDAYTQFAGWQAKLKESGEVSVAGPLPLDICSLDNVLAPGTKLEIILEPAAEAFRLLCTSDSAQLKISFQDMFLEYRRLRLPASVLGDLLPSRRGATHRYVGPYTHVSAHEVPKGATMHVVPVYPEGHVLLKQVIVAQVPTANFRGTLSTNPYVFPHNSVNHLALRIDGVVATNSELTPDFDNHKVAREYYRLFTQTGKRASTSQGVLLTEDNFVNNHALFPFDLTPDECNSRHLHLSKTGQLDVEMRWKTALEDNIVVLVLATFDQVIVIDGETGALRSKLF